MHYARLLTAALFGALVRVQPASAETGDWVDQAMQTSPSDFVGYLAAGLVLATFCVNSMNTLRVLAIASNVAFVTYAYLTELAPVLLLHALLLPVNICRLAQSYCARRKAAHAAPPRRSVAS